MGISLDAGVGMWESMGTSKASQGQDPWDEASIPRRSTPFTALPHHQSVMNTRSNRMTVTGRAVHLRGGIRG